MERIVIEGGVPLQGKVWIGGAKNAALPVLAATLLSEGICTIRNVPALRDVNTIKILLRQLGSRITEDGHGTLRVDNSSIDNVRAPYELVRTMRASVLVLGPLLARFGRAEVSLPGGCAIGARPIDLHIRGLERLGAGINLEKGYVEAWADKLTGARIHLDIPTVTGTENLMMAATLAEGTTIIENAACEPEVVDLAYLLGKMGARIFGAGSGTIVIEGTSSSLKAAAHTIIPDRIEAGTFMIAAAITHGRVTLSPYLPDHHQALINKLREAGVEFEEDAADRSITLSVPDGLRPVDITTAPFPGFPTDMQAQIMALMCITPGTSLIREKVFENRFMHVSELRRMGADIRIDGHTAMVRGVDRLDGARVMATDLRASASLILAGLAARGETLVSRIYHLDRGYDRIEQRLLALGAKIRRERDE
jgi:UDP-N-acetylglucosamine 1-carboxyvinyltransferase